MKGSIIAWKYTHSNQLKTFSFNDDKAYHLVICPFCGTSNAINESGGMCTGEEPNGRHKRVMKCIVMFEFKGVASS